MLVKISKEHMGANTKIELNNNIDTDGELYYIIILDCALSVESQSLNFN